MFWITCESPLGTLLLTCEAKGLTGIYIGKPLPEGTPEDHPILLATAKWLDGYFAGNPLPIDIPLAPVGTVFQKQVWQILLDIPYGASRTYGDIAREVARLRGKEKMSAQAVGQAVGANPVNILIPCHRVLGAKGKLTGYSSGLEKKIWLLEHEKIPYEPE